MFFINAYLGSYVGYDRIKEYDTGKIYSYFSWGPKGTIEFEFYLTNYTILSANISPVFKVYKLEYYRYYNMYGLSLKISF